MNQVFYQLYYHLVWANTNREPQLIDELRPLVYETIQDKCRRMDCRLHALNSMADHIHVALEIPPARSVASVVGQLKAPARTP